MNQNRHRRRSSPRLNDVETLEARRLLASDVVITEIMYHPASNDSRQEFIELYNPSDDEVDLAGWTISNGVEFSFPDVNVASRGYLVVAADQIAFESAYPNVRNVVSGWSGRLANRGEAIEIADPTGRIVDRVDYADEGLWATRELDVVDAGFQGWKWHAEHDGAGASLELVDLGQANNLGHNWKASDVERGTPGRANSVARADVAPFMSNVRHLPAVPNSRDDVTVSVEIFDGAIEQVQATLFYRLDGAPSFQSALMTRSHQSTDLEGNAATFSGIVPALPDASIVEFYIEAVDQAGQKRTLPNFEVDEANRTANLLYQVLDDIPRTADWNPNDQPMTLLILRESERNMLADIGDGPLVEAESNAQFNATFVRIDGNSTDVRYNASIRNRGGSSRIGPPNNYRVDFAHDDPWNGSVSVNLNSRFVHTQIVGSQVFQAAGMPTARAKPIQVRVNGQDLAEPDGPLMFGSYVELETVTGSFPDSQFPNDRRGNLYRAISVGANSANLQYLGPDAAAYQTVYSKRTNEEQDDWTDLIELTRRLNQTSDASYVSEISEVVDVEQWLRYLALDSLLGNLEFGLSLGAGDNYWLYRGTEDTRFKIIPHDLDTILGRGRVGEPNRSIFSYTSVVGLNQLLTHPDIVPQYYQAFVDVIEEVYNPDTMHALIDRTLGHFVTEQERQGMKQFVVDRIAGVLAQLPQEFRITSNLPIVNGYHRTTLPVTELVGTADALQTKSVFVNGNEADWSPFTREWSISTTGEGETRSLVEFGSSWRFPGRRFQSTRILATNRFGRFRMEVWASTVRLRRKRRSDGRRLWREPGQ